MKQVSNVGCARAWEMRVSACEGNVVPLVRVQGTRIDVRLLALTGADVYPCCNWTGSHMFVQAACETRVPAFVIGVLVRHNASRMSAAVGGGGCQRWHVRHRR